MVSGSLSMSTNVIFRCIPVSATCIGHKAKKATNGRSIIFAVVVPVATAISTATAWSATRRHLLPLCCSTPPQCFNALNNSLRWENGYQAELWSERNTKVEKAPWLTSEFMSCSDTQKKTEERKKIHRREKGQDQCWTGSKDFSHAQANKLLMHYSHAVQLGTGTPLLERKKRFNILIASILQTHPREKIQGRGWGARRVYKANSARGFVVWGWVFLLFQRLDTYPRGC